MPRAIVTRSANPDQIGRQAMAVPRHQLAAWADYCLLGDVKLGVGVRFTDATRGNGGTTPAKVPSYALVDAMLGYDLQQWTLALNVRNLGNKTYLANCDGPAQTCYYGDQRRWTGTATYRW